MFFKKTFNYLLLTSPESNFYSFIFIIMKYKTSNLKQKITKPISKVGLLDRNVQFEVNGNAVNKSPESVLNKQKLSYSGGFKIPSELVKKENSNVISNVGQKQRVQAKQQIFKEFGVAMTENQNKSNKYLPKTKDQLASKVIETIQSKIDRIRFQREKIFNNDMKNVNFNSNFAQNSNYVLKISEPKKMQASHIPSSLQYFDLDNVTALHEAHKRDLKPIEQEYMQKKGHLIKIPELLKDKYENQQQQDEKTKKEMIYKIMRNQRQKKGDKKTKEEEEQEELNRLFQQKKRLDPKLAEYDLKYREFVLQKKSKQISKIQDRSNLFKWDKYKQPSPGKKKSKDTKKKQLQQNIIEQEQLQNKKKQIEEKQQNEENLKNLSGKYDLTKILITKNDKFIMKYIFKQLDTQKKGLISKTQLFDYCIANQLIKKEYNINEKWFFSDLDSFQTARKGILNYEECENFLLMTRNVKHPDIVLTQINKDLPVKPTNRSKLTRHELDYFEKVFKELDVNDDKIVKREQLLENLYLDPFVIKLLDMPAIVIEVIQKNITVRQIFQIILREYTTQKNQKKKKAKEYITLSQFLDYFNRWDSLDLTKLTRTQKSKSSNEISVFDIQPQILQLLQDIFNSIPRIYQNYICVKDFFEYCRKDPQIISVSDQLCRIQSVQTKLKLQTIKITLQRMHTECQEYQCWDNLKTYFSRRGRPQDWDQNKLSIKKELRQKEKSEFLKKMANTKKSLQKKQKQRSEALKDAHYKKSDVNNKVLEKAYNYTIPHPFPITDELKDKNTAMSNQKAIEYKQEYQQLKNKIKAIPLNKQILEPKLNKIQQQRKLKSQKNRQQSRNKTKNIQKPFSFYEKELIAKTLKEAALKYQKEQLLQLKLNTIKAQQIEIDLKKPYKQVIEENQEKNKKQIEKKKPVQVSKSLYPDNPKELQKQKRKNLEEKLNRLDEVDKKKKEELERIKEQKAQKNKKKNNILIQKKKRQEQQEVQRLKIKKKLADISFEPKINNYVPEKRQDIQQKKKQLEDEKIEQFIREKQQKRKKILEFQPKQEPKINIQQLSANQILDKLSDISFEDLIQEEGDRSEYLKQKQFQKIPFANKKKIKKDRANAMMQRQRLDMETQEKRRREQLRQKQAEKKQKKEKNKEKVITGQLQRTQGKKIDPENQEFQKNFTFHKSKALRRYRDLMQGKKPLSQYDMLSNENARSEANKQQKRQQIFEYKEEDQEQQKQ